MAALHVNHSLLVKCEGNQVGSISHFEKGKVRWWQNCVVRERVSERGAAVGWVLWELGTMYSWVIVRGDAA